jgi:hypothetical protein
MAIKEKLGTYMTEKDNGLSNYFDVENIHEDMENDGNITNDGRGYGR